MINFYFIACLKLFIYNKITHSSIYIEGVRKQLYFFSYVLGENRERENKRCVKRTKGVERQQKVVDRDRKENRKKRICAEAYGLFSKE